MKVKCNNCKKSFDPEKYGDFCPHCGMFVSEGFTVGKETPKRWRKNEGKEQNSRKKIRIWIYVAAIVILILVPIIGPPISGVMAKRAYEKNRDGVREPQYYAVGETMEMLDHQVVITKVEWLEETAHYTGKEGQQLLEISYEAERETGTVVLYGLSRVYLKVDRQYIKASEMDAVKSSEFSYYHRSIKGNNGKFGFTVPEDAQSVELVIQVYSDTLRSRAELMGTYVVKIKG